jgi:hypothetical protein
VGRPARRVAVKSARAGDAYAGTVAAAAAATTARMGRLRIMVIGVTPGRSALAQRP